MEDVNNGGNCIDFGKGGIWEMPLRFVINLQLL